MASKNDGLAPKTAPLSICPQCKMPMQHVTRGGQRVLECPNKCTGDTGTGSAAASIKEPKEKEELVDAR